MKEPVESNFHPDRQLVSKGHRVGEGILGYGMARVSRAGSWRTQGPKRSSKRMVWWVDEGARRPEGVISGQRHAL